MDSSSGDVYHYADIRRRFLPTTLEELRDHQHSEAEQQLLTEEDPSTYENRV